MASEVAMVDGTTNFTNIRGIDYCHSMFAVFVIDLLQFADL